MPTDVCLISMPYSSITAPSIGLGLLETYITEYGNTVDCIHGFLNFAEKIGLEDYELINTSVNEYLIGEWTFSRAAFGKHKRDDNEFFDLFTDLTDDHKNRFLAAREHAEKFIEELAADILSKNPKIVGCTSTFQQNCASLALLKRLKAKNPDIITMMGGCNCEGIMGQTLSEEFLWVDYIFSGECDDVIGEFIDNIIKGKTIDYHNLPYGFITQKHQNLITNVGDTKNAPRASVLDMSKVGMPSYDSYFESLENSTLVDIVSPGILAETSRGCWWGEKQHCTFCGLNGSTMTHRSKQPEVALKEFEYQSNRYSLNKFMVVDNILPVNYMNTVLPALAEKKEYSIFYETKANLKKQHVEAIAKAGIKWIQPGFEGLHDDFLKAIRKGTTAIQNLAALKWCRTYGVRVTWNFLCGLPNDEEIWYEEMAEWLPQIAHLHPPGKEMTEMRYHRFSPYFNEAKDFGLELTPNQCYQYVYPLSAKRLNDLAYFFEKKSNKTKQMYSVDTVFDSSSPGLNQMQKLLDEWGESWSNGAAPILYLIDHGHQIIVMDTRKVATSLTHVLTDLSAVLYRLCAEPVTPKRLMTKINEFDASITEAQVDEIIAKLINDKILIHLSKCYMALAFIAEDTDLLAISESPYGSLDLSKPVRVKNKKAS